MLAVVGAVLAGVTPWADAAGPAPGESRVTSVVEGAAQEATGITALSEIGVDVPEPASATVPVGELVSPELQPRRTGSIPAAAPEDVVRATVAELRQLVSRLPNQAMNVLDSGTWRLCGVPMSSYNGLHARCSPDVPIGSTWTIDVDGYPIRGSLTPTEERRVRCVPVNEVNCNLPPIASVPTPTTGFTFDAEPMSPYPAPVHVFAVFEAPGAYAQVVVGFDGRQESGLPGRSVASIAIDDPIAAVRAEPPFTISADLRFTGGAKPAAITMAAAPLSYGAVGQPATVGRTSEAWIGFDVMPAQFHLGVELGGVEDGLDRTVVTATNAPGADVTALLTLAKDDGGWMDLGARFEDLPHRAKIIVKGRDDRTVVATDSSSIHPVIEAEVRTFGPGAHPSDPQASPADTLQVRVEGLPAVTQGIDVTAPDDGLPQVHHTASSDIPLVHVLYEDHVGGSATEAEVIGLPPSLVVSGSLAALTVEATTGAPLMLPAAIGRLTIRHGSDGQFPVVPAFQHDNHVVYDTVPDVYERIELAYSGLEKLHVAWGEVVDFTLHTDAARPFSMVALTPDSETHVRVQDVPSELTVNADSAHVEYWADGAVDSITVGHHDRRDTFPRIDAFSVQVTGLPDHFRLDYVTGAVNHFDWTASGEVGSVGFRFAENRDDLRFWETGATLRGIPPKWNGTMSESAGTFYVPGGGDIDQLNVYVSNHGALRRPADASHNYVFATATASGNVDAALQVKAIRSLDFAAADDGLRAALAAGGGERLDASAELHLSSTEAVAGSFRVDPLPAEMSLVQQGARIVYTGAGSPDVLAAVRYGTPAYVNYTIMPALVHGLSAEQSPNGVRARLYLTGAPSLLDIDPVANSFQVDGWNPKPAGAPQPTCHPSCPPLGSLTVFANLRDIYVDARVTLPSDGLGPLSLTLGKDPMTVTYTGGATIPAIAVDVLFPNADKWPKRVGARLTGIPTGVTISLDSHKDALTEASRIAFGTGGSPLGSLELEMWSGPRTPLAAGELGVRAYVAPSGAGVPTTLADRNYIHARIRDLVSFTMSSSETCRPRETHEDSLDGPYYQQRCESRVEVAPRVSHSWDAVVDIRSPRLDGLGEPRLDKDDVAQVQLTRVAPAAKLTMSKDTLLEHYPVPYNQKRSTNLTTDILYEGRTLAGGVPTTSNSALAAQVQVGHDGELLSADLRPLPADLRVCTASKLGRHNGTARCSGTTREGFTPQHAHQSVQLAASERVTVNLDHCKSSQSPCTWLNATDWMRIRDLNLQRLKYESGRMPPGGLLGNEADYKMLDTDGHLLHGKIDIYKWTGSADSRKQERTEIVFGSKFWATNRRVEYVPPTATHKSGQIYCGDDSKFVIEPIDGVHINVGHWLCDW